MNDLGDKLKQRRSEKGLTLSELAEKTRISKGYISRLENGHSLLPSYSIVIRLAEALGTSPDDLLSIEVPVTNQNTPISLQRLAEELELPWCDIEMLRGINYRGKQPESETDWWFILEAIRRSVKRNYAESEWQEQSNDKR